MADNILKNPTLTGFSKPPEVVLDGQGNQQVIEHPTDWRFVYTPNQPNNDPKWIPQSLHRDRGFDIAAGWRAWAGGYRQTVVMRKGQRYVCKAIFLADVNPADKGVDWRFTLSRDGQEVGGSPWSTGPKKRELDHLFVVEARADITVDLTFWARSQWADNATDFYVYAITMEKVAPDYAGNQVQYVGFESEDPDPDPDPEPEPEPGDRAWVEALPELDRQRVELGRLALTLNDPVGDDIHSVQLYRLVGRLAKLLDVATA